MNAGLHYDLIARYLQGMWITPAVQLSILYYICSVKFAAHGVGQDTALALSSSVSARYERIGHSVKEIPIARTFKGAVRHRLKAAW